MNFYTADTHFYHNNIIKYENRPFDGVEAMNKALIEKWNNKVSKGDCVYILGDFAFTGGVNANNILDQLNGQKFLIKGNHDSFLKDKDFDTKKFVWVKDYARIKDGDKDVVLFHYPIAQWDKAHHGSIHLYGHIHSNHQDHHPMNFDLGNAFNVGVDVRNYEPVSLQEILNSNKVTSVEGFNCSANQRRITADYCQNRCSLSEKCSVKLK